MGSGFSGGAVMRRILQGLCAFVFLFALAFPLHDVSAKPRYFDDAQNYLIWDTGTHHGSAVDLSSAVVVKDTPEYIIIAALDYFVTYDKSAEYPMRSQNTVYFKEYKQTSDLYFTSDYENRYQNGEWRKLTNVFVMIRHAYPIIKERAIQNTKKISAQS
ncbi:hypothetical protein [uncultured Megasphaera sp.]|uniref:hypothetical protein n=2 Tax=uncultured Megasphaera sp. TaxID=165188 RepID=UPI0025EBB8C9|nr:hypothetical protein [uncultured Megasphaera sp.]